MFEATKTTGYSLANRWRPWRSQKSASKVDGVLHRNESKVKKSTVQASENLGGAHPAAYSTMMTSIKKALCLNCYWLALVLALTTSVSASVFLPFDAKASSVGIQHPMLSSPFHAKMYRQKLKSDRQWAAQLRRKTNPNSNRAAMAIPGYGVAEQGGSGSI
jgi:hypothetical protein